MNKKSSTKKTALPSPWEEFAAAVLPRQASHVDYLITIAEGGEADASAFLEEKGGMASMSSTAELSAGELSMDVLPQPGSGTLFARLGVAVAKLDAEHFKFLQDISSGQESIVAIEPAPIFYAAVEWDQQSYLQGYADGIDSLVASLGGRQGALPAIPGLTTAQAASGSTWGIRAVRADASQATGQGVRVAILDTGIDLQHPDFAGRQITSRSFIVGEEVQDGHSHGTHCAGVACGPRQPHQGPRYGVASQSDIFIGKVLSNSGGSRGRSVELGMEWALANRCDVISMSLGSPVLPGQGPIQAYERIGSRALAAGNDSVRRRGLVNPVGSPANAPSILAVAALDENLAVADFSNGGVNPGAEIDLAGPGVDILSSVPGGYGQKSGTSMATPHIAGLAALHAETTGKRGRDLWDLLISTARLLPLSSQDVGGGLGQAP